MAALNAKQLIQMEPLKLLEELENEVKFPVITDISGDKNKRMAAEALNRDAAYICFFREMEIMARCMKREARKHSRDEASRLLGLEEVFETYKKIAEQHYDKIVKMMTLVRLSLDEYKIMGETM